MAKTLLRSGNLDDFQAVGGGGQAVFESALQIREALRLRKQQSIVDCLAIPQVNDGGDRVDWYAPIEGAVTSWKAAGEDDRFSRPALPRKYAGERGVAEQKVYPVAENRPAAVWLPAFQKRSSSLAKNFLYLVDGKPVICFWGFVNLNENARDDVLSCLRDALIPEPAPVVIEEPEARTGTRSRTCHVRPGRRAADDSRPARSRRTHYGRGAL
ncbi:SsrAB activated protein [Enterobacter cancerogenus]|uniref:SsrAB activated protein n=1 Tax=Enterobacter cancerogenus TaxID=69218 RepID=A0A484ZB80_9ENTR|nr:SsrAB activated protein [Enterobacter cancerogenus]